MKLVLKKENIYSKRGSYIIEAAIVLPIVILVTITTVLIIMFFYNQTMEQCRMHVIIRKEAGNFAGNTIYLSDIGKSEYEDMEIYREKGVAGGTVTAKKYLIMKNKGVLHKKGTYTVSCTCYSVNAPAYIRYRTLIRGVANNDKT